MPAGLASITQPDDYRARLAQMLAQQSFDTSPKGHWTQAAAQMAQALVAGNMMNDQDTQQRAGVDSLLNAPGLGGTPSAPAPSFTGSATPAMPRSPPMPSRIYDQSEMNPLDAAVATNGELASGVNAPRPYAPLIGKAAIDNDIPANVLAAQTKQESNFNPQAVSSAGAQGISQFMPGTAKEMGINPLDPAQAIPAQGRYMRQQLDSFGGDMAKALAAYNGGPGRLASVGGDIGRMPTESQNYVRSILANAQPTVQTASSDPRFAPAMPQPMAGAGQSNGPQMAQAQMFSQAPQQPAAPTRSAVNIPPETAAYIRQLISNPNTRAYGLELYSKFTAPTDSFEQVTGPNGQIIGQRSRMTGEVKPYPQADRFETVTDANGRAIGQRNVVTGKVEAVPNNETNDIKEWQFYADGERKAGRIPEDFTGWMRGNKKAGATQVDASTRAENEESKERGKGLAKRLNDIADDGAKASEDGVMFQRFGDLLSTVKTGGRTALLEKIRQMTNGVVNLDPKTDEVQALNAAINHVAPRLRVPGSGSQSDRELANFLNSIPSLAGTPEGNQKILQTMAGIVEHRRRAAEIATAYQVGDLTGKEATARIAALPSPFEQRDEKPSEVGASRRDAGPVKVTSPDDARKLPSGTKIILPDGSPGVVP